MSNQLEFKPGARLLLNQNIEGEMIFGTGKAYGLGIILPKENRPVERLDRLYPEQGRKNVPRYE